MPPEVIDFNRLDSVSKSFIDILMRIHIELVVHDDSIVSQTVRILDEYWPHAWSWIVALSNAFLSLDTSEPLTSAGTDTFDRFTRATSMVIFYPMFDPDIPPGETASSRLIPLLQSYPGIFSLIPELWLCTSKMDLRDQCSVYVSQLPTRGADGDGNRTLECPLFSSMERPEAFIKPIIHEITDRSGSFGALRDTLALLNPFLMSAVSSNVLAHFIRRDAIRWVTLLIERIASSAPMFYPGQFLSYYTDKIKARAQVIVESIRFLDHCISKDVFFALQILDRATLLSMFKAKALLVGNAHEQLTSPLPPTCTLVYQFAQLIKTLIGVCLHRPVLVRLVHWIRKIEGLEMDTMDAEAAELCRSFLDVWDTLKKDVSRRRVVKNTRSSEPIHNRPMCDNLDCPDPLGRELTSKLLRCTGCKSRVYCSRKCQKVAWGRDNHKKACLQTRELARAGAHHRLPTFYDYAFIRDQIGADLKLPDLGERIRIARSPPRLAGSDPKHEERMRPGNNTIIWLDYSEHPVSITTYSIDETRARLDECVTESGSSYLMDTDVLGLEFGGVSVVAMVPWYRVGKKSYPMVVGLK
ncbi:hypothetical protein AAF712_008924 [Marasmius tenuissimus]|uniref:MYND-type domain-containing protein n=1 Tax=Marasmius tenuissimus TaxID=585030 RepID=A0ABR2ZR80_9AGAR